MTVVKVTSPRAAVVCSPEPLVPRVKRSPVIRARCLVQVAFLVLVVWLGAQFTVWTLDHTAGNVARASRPASVEGFLPISALMSLRVALAVGLAVGIYLGITTAFRVSGHWRGVVSEGEYACRLQEIDSPLYTHVGGMAGAEAGPNAATTVGSHGER